MTTAASPQRKGAATRQKILERAYALAGQVGLSGLTIGELASGLGLSKSGLFSHFGSKEQLQIEVLEFAAAEFEQRVFRPSLQAPRGVARLALLFENWMTWMDGHERRGCVFLSAAIDFDDRDGIVRDAIALWFSRLDALLERAFRIACEEGQLRPELDCAQAAGELHGILLKYHLDRRLLRARTGRERARRSLRSLLENNSPHPGALFDASCR